MNKPEKIQHRVLGSTPIRPDGLDKVTGAAKFGDDIHLQGMLHGKVLRSPHPHAVIKSIDTSKAQALPGVRAIVTGADFPKVDTVMMKIGEAGTVDMQDIADNCMAKDKVLYDGHALAAVAADNPHIAEQAVALIEVDYELLEPVMTVGAAMADGAPVLHKEFTPGSFVAPTEKTLPNASRLQIAVGDIENGFAEADVIVEREFDTETVHQGYIESHITTVRWDRDDHITVWTTTQGQFAIRDQLAAALNMPMSRIKVIPLEIGGGFGGKDQIYLDPVAAVLSKKSDRPVKMAMSRIEVLKATGPSSGTHMKVKIGAKKDGTLVAADFSGAFEAGLIQVDRSRRAR